MTRKYLAPEAFDPAPLVPAPAAASARASSSTGAPFDISNLQHIIQNSFTTALQGPSAGKASATSSALADIAQFGRGAGRDASSSGANGADVVKAAGVDRGLGSGIRLVCCPSCG